MVLKKEKKLTIFFTALEVGNFGLPIQTFSVSSVSEHYFAGEYQGYEAVWCFASMLICLVPFFFF